MSSYRNAGLQKLLDKFEWYQTIDFGDGLKSNGCAWCGDPVWKNILEFLPENLEGKTVLDLGCNAGIFSVRSALMGAKEVTGVESNDWKDDYLSQAELVKNVFQIKYKRVLPITYIKGRIEDVLERPHPVYDYCFAIACLYYTSDPDRVMKRISQICTNLIMRLRDESIIKRWTDLAENNGFKLQEYMRENWSQKLSAPADDFYLFHYAR